MVETLYEGIYLLKTREFVNSKQEIYKIGRSNNLSTRVLNYPNKSVVYLMIECIDSPKHEKYLIKLFTKYLGIGVSKCANKIFMSLEYYKEIPQSLLLKCTFGIIS